MEGYKTIEVEKDTEQKQQPKEDEPSNRNRCIYQFPELLFSPIIYLFII